MIEKLNYGWQAGGGYTEPTCECVCNKINELVDYVNTLCQEHDIHEEQIDKLQMKLEPHKCEPVENAQDPYVEQHKWVGCLCWFWDYERENATLGLLTDI